MKCLCMWLYVLSRSDQHHFELVCIQWFISKIWWVAWKNYHIHVYVNHVSNKAMCWTTSSGQVLTKYIINTLDLLMNYIILFNIMSINSRMIWIQWRQDSYHVTFGDHKKVIIEYQYSNKHCRWQCVWIVYLFQDIYVLKSKTLCWFTSPKIKTVKQTLGWYFMINCLI